MDVRKIAKLANLTITDAEEDKFKDQFEQTLKTVDLINELDTSKVEPTSQVTGLKNVMREDIVDHSRLLTPPTTNNGYFVVPAIFNAE